MPQAPLKRAPGRDLELMLSAEGRLSARLAFFFAATALRVSRQISARLARERLSAKALAKYSEDQPRDDHGRWEGGGVSLERTDERAWSGKQEPDATRLGKQEAGVLGEQIGLAYIQSLPGHEDARVLNGERSNFPVDQIGDHELFEVKTGQVTNTPSAQQWRATIGQPGKAESAWLKSASPADKAAHNEAKAQAIMDRKQAAVDSYSMTLGRPVGGKTLTVLIHPDKGIADIHVFDGFHSRIGYNSAQAKAGYVGSFRYSAV